MSFPEWSGAPTPETMRAVLRVAKDGKALESIGIGTKANLTLGRKSELCDVVLEHHTISRRHAVIMHRGDGTLHISDLASAQGSTLNGQLLTPNNPAELHEGDILRFGQSSRIYTLSLEQQIPQQGSDALAAELPATFRGNDDGRRRREAEIAAMTASLVGAPRAPNTSAVEVESKAKAAIPALHEKSLATSSPTRKSTAASDEAENEDKEPLSLEERARSLGIPASHEAVMEGHSKAALCMAIDPAGGRVLSGALDYKVKLWDFGGMDQRHKAFKEIEPQAGYAVLALSFSPTGDRFLAATSSVQPAVFDKEGRELLRFVRGDMYLADSANTKGHTHPVTGAAWNPSASDQVLSCSSDGTLRTWDLNGPTALEDRLVCKQVFKLKDARGKRVGATACAHDPDGCDYIVGGAADGSIHFWAPNKGSAARPDLIRSAHSGGVTSVVFSPSGRQLASRGDDSCVRVWDVRKKSEPLQVFPDLESFFETSNVAWSPSGRHLVAGTSVRKGAGTGALKFFGLESPAPVLELGIAPGASVVQVCWHSKLNQVLASTSAGPLRLFYDPLLSRHGALLTASRTPRRKDPMDYIPVAPQAVGVIINPHALPMFRDPSQKRPRRGEEDLKPGELRRPGKPVNGPGSQTESVSRARHHFTEMFMEGRLKTSNLRDQDSRVELLKYAGREKPGERVLAETTMEQDKEDAESAAKKARGR